MSASGVLQLSLPVAIIVAVGALAASAVSIAAQEKKGTQHVEAIMSRALLEKAAFAFCAQHRPSELPLEEVERVWKVELADVAKLLTDSGYDQAFISALPQRYDLKAAIPAFADRAAADRYCDMLGDWEQRYFIFQVAFPSLELRREAQ